MLESSGTVIAWVFSSRVFPWKSSTLTRNSATGNGGEGITLVNGSAQNTVQNNTVSGSFSGIQLGDVVFGGANQNTIQSNTAKLNVRGIWVVQGTGNSIQGNTALDNRDWDLGDQNPGCDSNVWSSNQFVTDNVAGASDGGPGTGCIQ